MAPKRRVLKLPGCGFGTFFAWGALDARGPSEALSALSGGGVAALLHLCGVDLETFLPICLRYRDRMTRRLDPRGALTQALRDVIPDDAHVRCNGRLCVLHRSAWPCFEVRRVEAWTSKSDLIACVVAGCFPWPTWYRDGYVIDAILTYDDEDVDTLDVPLVVRVPDEARARALYSQGHRDAAWLECRTPGATSGATGAVRAKRQLAGLYLDRVFSPLLAFAKIPFLLLQLFFPRTITPIGAEPTDAARCPR